MRDQLKVNEHFIEENLADLAASMQYAIIKSLSNKVERAVKELRCRDLVIAGGVSANSGLKAAMQKIADKYHRRLFVPTIDLTTDNAAMIAVCGYFKYLQNDFSTIHAAPYSTAGLTLKTLTELPK